MTFEHSYLNLRAGMQMIGIENFEQEARWAMEAILNRTYAEILTNPNEPMDPQSQAAINDLLTRRRLGEPLAYILGFTEFLGLKIKVRRGILIPRNDTESVALRGIEFLKNKKMGEIRVLDLGTGSGCLLLSILSRVPGSRGVGVDLSPVAVVTAKENAKGNGLANRTHFINANVEDLGQSEIKDKFDLVVANPPYLKRGDHHIESSVSQFEPELALYAGDGLECYRTWPKAFLPFLKPGGAFLTEIGMGQAEDVENILRQTQSFDPITTGEDDLKITRWVMGVKRG